MTRCHYRRFDGARCPNPAGGAGMCGAHLGGCASFDDRLALALHLGDLRCPACAGDGQVWCATCDGDGFVARGAA